MKGMDNRVKRQIETNIKRKSLRQIGALYVLTIRTCEALEPRQALTSLKTSGVVASSARDFTEASYGARNCVVSLANALCHK